MHPGYEQFCQDLGTLLSTYPPPFIYIQDIEVIKTTVDVIDTILHELSNAPSSSTPKICHARVDAIACFSTRLIYESVINSLVGWTPSWEDGCSNWMPENDLRWNENLDTFLHGLQAAYGYIRDKGKGKQKEDSEDVRFVVVVERAERLKENHPELIVPLTRLAELARLDLTVIFVCQVGWEDIRPPLGASPDPFFMDIQAPSKENIVKSLMSKFSTLSRSSDDILTNVYHPALGSLYTHFITMLCDVCFPFSHDPQELQYIAAARWPGFVKPLIDDHKQRLEEDMDDELPTEFMPPSEDLRIRLIRYFNPSLTTALEALLPRQTNAADWARANEPPDNLLTLSRAQETAVAPSTTQSGMRTLPRMSKFILIASFLASTNPAKSDLRMFGRGLDEKKRKRRATKAAGKTKGPSKLPQRLIGPAPFGLDRMVAILGALLEENDIDSRLAARAFSIPGEYTDMEISRVGVFSSVTELTSMGLLHRTSPSDRLDGPPMFKAAVSYDATLLLAKELDVAVNDLLWDPI